MRTGISIPVLICYRNTSSAWRHLDRYVSACLNTGTCATSRAKAESLGRFFSLLGGAKRGSQRKARQFCKVKHLREHHVRERVSSYTSRDVAETLDGVALNTWPLFFSRRKRSRRRASIHYCHDYGGSCLLLVKFRLLYVCCGALPLHRCIPGCLRATITYSVFRRRRMGLFCRVALTRPR